VPPPATRVTALPVGLAVRAPRLDRAEGWQAYGKALSCDWAPGPEAKTLTRPPPE